ncbi:hypothetical protein [Microvirga sp. 2TAF3]
MTGYRWIETIGADREREFFELCCQERLFPFYEKLGFEQGSSRLMFHTR